MRKFTLFVITTLIFTALGFRSYAQDEMMPPKPVDNKVYEAMVGDWTGESDMMGMKFNDEVKNYWSMNHQYIIMEVTQTSKDNPSMKYSGIGIMGIDKDGNPVMWWFDDWGASAMMSGSGTFDGMKCHMISTNAMGKDDRTVSFKNGDMVMSWVETMKGKDGKEMTMNGETVYKKK
jgi:hypothetical protein